MNPLRTPLVGAFRRVPLVLAAVLLLAGPGLPLAFAEIPGQSQGMGWCPICGRDMPLSHDFTHGRGSGTNRPPREPQPGGVDTPPNVTYNRPDPGVVNYNRGIDLYRAGRYAEAEAAFRASLTFLPSRDPDPWRMIGLCLQRQEKYDEANAAYNRALRRNPFDARARRLRNGLMSWQADCRGVELAERGQWQEAADLFRSAIRLDPRNDNARKNLEFVQLQLKRVQTRDRIRRSVAGLADDAARPAASGVLGFALFSASLFERGDRESAPVDATGRGVNELAGGAVRWVRGSPAVQADPAVSRHVLDERRAGGGKVTGPVRPRRELPISMDPEQIAREKRLCEPLDLKALAQLSEDDAVGLLIAREDAAVSVATRSSADELEAEFARLRGEGRLAPGENILRRQREDPKFAAELESILQTICKREMQRVHAARQASLDGMAAYHARREAGGERQAKIDAAVRRFLQEEDAALSASANKALKDMQAVYESLEKEGVIRPGENLVNRMRDDAAFRDRVNQASEEIGRRWKAEDVATRLGTIRKVTAELQRFQTEDDK